MEATDYVHNIHAMYTLVQLPPDDVRYGAAAESTGNG